MPSVFKREKALIGVVKLWMCVKILNIIYNYSKRYGGGFQGLEAYLMLPYCWSDWADCLSKQDFSI